MNRGPARAGAPPPRVRLPFLERLLDQQDDGRPPAPPPSPAEALEALRQAVQRSLEALLNARRRRRPLPAHLGELSTSLLAYGIPDPAAGTYNQRAKREAVAREIEATLRRFEPRLRQVQVQLVEDTDDEWGRLHLKVEAVLRADPMEEPVSYATLLEPVHRIVTVREGTPR